MLLVLEYYFVVEKIEIMMWSGKLFEKIERNEERILTKYIKSNRCRKYDFNKWGMGEVKE